VNLADAGIIAPAIPLHLEIARALQMVAAGQITPVIGARFALQDLLKAFDLIRSGANIRTNRHRHRADQLSRSAVDTGPRLQGEGELIGIFGRGRAAPETAIEILKATGHGPGTTKPRCMSSARNSLGGTSVAPGRWGCAVGCHTFASPTRSPA
jgi:hypothetical protein